LADPDPVVPVLTSLADALRAALSDKAQQFDVARASALARIDSAPVWSELGDDAKAEYLNSAGLAEGVAASVGTTAQLLRSLDEWPLADWQVRIDAIPVQVDKAYKRAAAAQANADASGKEPVSVGLPKAVIRTSADLDRYLAELRATVSSHLNAGDSVVI
jgi:hypothetical protein